MKTKSLLIIAVLATAIFGSAGLIKAGPLPIVQTAALVTNPATNITSTSATLSGTPRGAGACYFEYGPTTTYGFTSTITEKVPALATYVINVSGLISPQLYHFRAVCFPSAGGLRVYGSDKSFATLSNLPPVSISFTSPAKGETVTQGTNETVQWTATGTLPSSDLFTISLINPATNYSLVLGSNLAPLTNSKGNFVLNGGYYNFNWVVSSAIPAGTQYQIQVSDSLGIILPSGASSAFNIAKKGSYCIKDLDCHPNQTCLNNSCVTNPPLTVISPNGGETLTIGQIYNITWDKGNFPNTNVIIGLQDTNYYKGFVGITGSIPNTGSYQWTVALPTTLTAGINFQPDNNYIISIGSVYNSAGYYESDTSDAPFTISAATTQPLITVTKNPAIADNTISPNTSNAKIGSFIVQNTSVSHSVRLTSLNTNGMVLDLSALKTSDTTGSGSTPIQPTGNDTFSVNDVLSPGASMTIDIFANVGSATSGTIQMALSVSSIDLTDNTTAISPLVQGQTMTIGGTSSLSAAIVASSTTPSQYIASSSSGAQNASQATFNFTATGGSATITELKFSTINNAVSNICVGNICAQPVNGVADLTGLNINIIYPINSAGINQTAQISYAPVGIGGLTPGTTSVVSLYYVKYVSGGTTATIAPNINAPMITLVGSVPTVAINQPTPAAGLILGAQNQIGQVTVSASVSGAIKVRQINFVVAGATGLTITNPFLAIGNTTITGSSCAWSPVANAMACTFNSGITPTYASDFTIAPGQSQTFNLFATVSGTASGTITLSTSLASGGFYWDDTSTNGASGTGLVATIIPNFPTNSWSITGGGSVTPVTFNSSLVTSSTTPSQYIASGSSGAQNASQATFNFSSSGPSTITDLKFRTINNAVTNICTQSSGQTICASPVSGIALMNGLNLTVPSGDGGMSQNFSISYAGVGQGGLASGTTSTVSLAYVRYTSGGTATAVCDAGCTNTMTAISTPTITLVGSVPTVSINQTTPSTNLILGAQNQIGQVTVSASPSGAIRLNKMTFYLGSSGLNNFVVTNPTFTFNNQPIQGVSCITNGSQLSGYTAVCTLGSGYATDYVLAPGSSATFGLLATVNGTASGSASVSTSLAAAGFLWDDTSTNGASGVGLNGNLIYNFPTNSWTITGGGGVTPSITVTSPNGGETWKIGETHNITWTSTGLSSSSVVINLLANTGNNPTVTIATGIPASQGSYSWTIPSNLALGNYTMWITNPSLANGTSGQFTIIAATTTCNAQTNQCVVGGGGSPCISSMDCAVPQVTQNLSINGQSSNGPVTVSGAPTITWTSSNANSCVASSCSVTTSLPVTGVCPAGNSADPLWSGTIAPSGTKTVSAVTQPIIYSLICKSANVSGGSPNNSLGATPAVVVGPVQPAVSGNDAAVESQLQTLFGTDLTQYIAAHNYGPYAFTLQQQAVAIFNTIKGYGYTVKYSDGDGGSPYISACWPGNYANSKAVVLACNGNDCVCDDSSNNLVTGTSSILSGCGCVAQTTGLNYSQSSSASLSDAINLWNILQQQFQNYLSNH